MGASLPCEDLSLDDPVMVAHLNQLWLVIQDYTKSELIFLNIYVSALSSYGCATLSDNILGSTLKSNNFDPCRESGDGGWGWETKPLSYFCPASCGCRGGDDHCPDSCPANAT